MRHVPPKVVVNPLNYDPKKHWVITHVERINYRYKYKFYFKTVHKIKGKFQTVCLQADSRAEAWERIGFPQWKEDLK